MLPVDSICVVASDLSAAGRLNEAGIVAKSAINIDEAFLFLLDSAIDRPGLKDKLSSAGYTKVFETFYFPTECPTDVRTRLVRSLFSYIEKSYESYVDPARNIACYEMLFQLASNVTASGSIDLLDFGCGTGLIQATKIPRVAHTLVGYDFSEPMRRNAEKHGLSVIESLEGNASLKYDVILASFVLHLGIDGPTMAQLISLLRDGGVFVANFHKDMFLHETVEMLRRNTDDPVSIKLTPSGFGTAMIAQRTL